MATRQHKSTTRESIRECNEAVSRRFHVTLAVYKTIKATTQLIGVVGGILAMQQGADPMTSLTIIGAILVGPEILEYTIANEPPRDHDRKD
ncbi:hypothetical protein NP511_02020 [Natrinema thermotolerans]|uniref:Uncharacterized protein n=1 Tax=Natrinema thermotolerans TaxID=121872 RepID=A0AAF0T6C6_9EURY|nr:hypothetical protein [Natrinema thermotolerans]ELZ12488.1 hypothetical protein C478_10441 [Natrinema thermotolerans DSM 11552]WPH65838.1 hypothetical protein HJTV4_gp14 [Haloarchaeal virus HJTV-4]QCC60743.1 hypothetical protein DVR14_19715 [Natrinema thermotolerans]QCC61621.1 hypothetical protein DVR14_23845 [Natrinema thermotolerans]WMT07787.1 hypothetical protein NP511_20735 [Natrinema thermotolerans]